MTFFTVKQIKEAHKNSGGYFFSPATMRFFRSKIPCSRVYHGKYFITSEQFTPSNGIPFPRKYTIRKVSPDGSDISTAKEFGEFQQFNTLQQAKKALRIENIRKVESA